MPDLSAILQTFRERPTQPAQLISSLRASAPSIDVQILVNDDSGEQEDTWRRLLRPGVDHYQRSVDNTIAFANTDSSQLRDNLDKVEVDAFDDYNPPPVDALETKRRHEEESDEFEEEAALSLDQVRPV